METETKGTPVTWSRKQLIDRLAEELSEKLGRGERRLHPKQLGRQLVAHTECKRILDGWDGDTTRRVELHRRLLELAPEALETPVPVCVRCGECCRKASPSLHSQDLGLVRGEKIKLEQLVTYRRGETMRDLDGRPVMLEQERIKLREKPGSSECIFLDPETELCTIYEDRPWECRAQACWDPALALELQKHPWLTRADVVKELEELCKLLEEHDRRCRPERFEEVFSSLAESAEPALADEAVEIVAFEEHFRTFVSERFGLPAVTLDFFFGRSFASQVGRYGFEVVQLADGARLLRPAAK